MQAFGRINWLKAYISDSVGRRRFACCFWLFLWGLGFCVCVVEADLCSGEAFVVAFSVADVAFFEGEGGDGFPEEDPAADVDALDECREDYL